MAGKRFNGGYRGVKKVQNTRNKNRFEALDGEPVVPVKNIGIEDGVNPNEDHLSIIDPDYIRGVQSFARAMLENERRGFTSTVDDLNVKWYMEKFRREAAEKKEKMDNKPKVDPGVIIPESRSGNCGARDGLRITPRSRGPLKACEDKNSPGDISSEHECSYEAPYVDSKGALTIVQGTLEAHKREADVEIIERKREEWAKEEILHRPMLLNMKVETGEEMPFQVRSAIQSALPEEVCSEYGLDDESNDSMDDYMERSGFCGISMEDIGECMEHMEKVGVERSSSMMKVIWENFVWKRRTLTNL